MPLWPCPEEPIEAAVLEALRSGEWRRYHGANARRLAEALGERFGVPHVQLCCSGSIAVELALRAVQVARGEEVIVAAYDYPGNYRAIEAIGAQPVLVDLTPGRWAVDPEAVREAGSERTKAVLVSHLHGTMADMPTLRSICDARGWALVEDACQVPGASIAGQAAGTWGDAGVLSFGGSKLLSAGNGGALLTASERVAQRGRVFAERPSDAFALSELQAAVLLPQVAALPAWHARRRHAAAVLAAALAAAPGGGEPLRCAAANPLDADAGFYKLGAWAADAEHRDRAVLAGTELGIPLGAGFRGLARRPPRRYRTAGALPHARAAGERTLVFDHRLLLREAQELEGIARRLGEFLTRSNFSECPLPYGPPDAF